MDTEFQDAVVGTMVHRCKAHRIYPAGAEEISIIYCSTTADSPARKLLVDLMCWAGGVCWTRNKDFARNAPDDFINDLIDALMQNQKAMTGVRPWVSDQLAYYVGSRKVKVEQ
jgi:hypothetical protein